MRFFNFFVLILLISCASAPTSKDGLYPVLSRWEKSPYARTCVEGNCQNGKGTLIVTQYIVGEKRVDKSKKMLHLQQDKYAVITVYEGQFSNNGSKMVGKVWHSVKSAIALAGQTYDIKFKTPLAKFKSDKRNLFYEGEIRLIKNSSYITKSNFTPSGKGGKLFSNHKWIRSVKILGSVDTFVLADVEFAKHPEFAKFKGLAKLIRDPERGNIQPLVGELTYKNGEIYKGSLWGTKRVGFGQLTKGGRRTVGYFMNDKISSVRSQSGDFPLWSLLKKFNGKTVAENGWTIRHIDSSIKFGSIDVKTVSNARPLFVGRVDKKGQPEDGVSVYSIRKHDFFKTNRWEKNVIFENHFFHSEASLIVASDFSPSKGERITEFVIGMDGYDYVRSEGKVSAQVNEPTVIGGCAELSYRKKIFVGGFPTGWLVTERGKLRYKHDYKMFKVKGGSQLYVERFYHVDEPIVMWLLPSDQLKKKGLQQTKAYLEATNDLLAMAQKDNRYCSPKVTPRKVGEYLHKARETIVLTTKERSLKIAKQAKESAELEVAYQKYMRERAARMVTCHRCGGHGQLFTKEKNTTRFVPNIETNNGVTRKTTTSITTTRKRWKGVCPVCGGAGIIDPKEKK